jgi:toxin ParE1/3/4
MLYAFHYTEVYQEDVITAYDWYDKVNEELSARFINELKEGEELICENPKANGKVFQSKFRRYLMPVFPYKIIYRIHQDEIYVISLYSLVTFQPIYQKTVKVIFNHFILTTCK